MSVSGKIKVVVVDDSALVRKLLTRMLESDPGIEVVGAAPDPFAARDQIKRLNPDVITLDVEMPRMDGITFLENLMRLRPMPVVMVSSLTHNGAKVTLQAMELGAVDFVTKPARELSVKLEDYAAEVVEKVKNAARASIRPLSTFSGEDRDRFRDRVRQSLREAGAYEARSAGTRQKLVAIGASTGGTEAIRRVLECLPPNSPPIVISQHIPANFSGPFAERLDACCSLSVKQAADRMPILPGHAYVAPGDYHLRVQRDGARLICRIDQSATVNRHRPSVDVMFDSVAEAAGSESVGVLLTGMGRDGAQGLLQMKQAGAATLVQDEATSTVWGMPGAANQLGAADEVLAIEEIPARMLTLASGKGARSA
ncbi:two-component system chemotaxis response regulator CheB [Natronospira proteinivora]|uniref:Protein-glutamate methylesterase/protein-glutamine glutaminase n=1 Tax=Natronospira proteinivora TaxID=1807133 RepID=A0ABT1G5B1_9GAMM|nr:chemotaxis response regulator protein-glutamate methylesterase [Natronospira proteinivora]MCP1726470.1 two-component system chemotaxis response regulator CheB [Natronospira proteinivora]